MGSVSTSGGSDPSYNTYKIGNLRDRTPVYDTSGGTQVNGNSTLTMDHPMRELFITNDNNTNMTIVVTGLASLNMTFLLLPGETLNERLPLFQVVTVTATGNWRWYVRSGRLE